MRNKRNRRDSGTVQNDEGRKYHFSTVSEIDPDSNSPIKTNLNFVLRSKFADLDLKTSWNTPGGNGTQQKVLVGVSYYEKFNNLRKDLKSEKRLQMYEKIQNTVDLGMQQTTEITKPVDDSLRAF